MSQQNHQKYAIRFGLGGIKAVGFNMMENAIKEREENGKFKDIYDFAQRVDPKSINKKSIEALAKSGSFDKLNNNRRQIAESFDILSSYAATKSEESSSNQMSLFGGLPEADIKPELKKIENWTKKERLEKEFEAFGFFLNEHPLDDALSDLRKRGIIFSDKIERDELEDGNLVKMSGVVAGSKHRSSARGRFAYMTISDPFGIFEAMIFDEALITSARDIMVDGSAIVLECLIRKDDGGTRILVRELTKLEDFIKNNKAQDKDFEDIRKQVMRSRNRDSENKNNNSSNSTKTNNSPTPSTPIEVEKKIFSRIEIEINSRAAVINIKEILSKSLNEKGSQIIFAIKQNSNLTKVELAGKYLLGEAEILKIKHIFGVVKVICL